MMDPLRQQLASFEYTPLDTQNGSIRVLQLTGATNELGDIICTLEATGIEDCEYLALSYCWGHQSAKRRIEVNGQALWVGQSLWAFLRQASQLYASTNLWIDAVCIDQSNVKERNHQVRQMGQIYSQAKEVIVWIGQGDEVLETTIQLFNRNPSHGRVLRQYFQEVLDGMHEDYMWELVRRHQIAVLVSQYATQHGVALRQGHRTASTPYPCLVPQAAMTDALLSHLHLPQVQSLLISHLYADFDLSKAVLDLCLLPYWSRLWIIQEILLARSIILLYEDTSISWSDFWRGIEGAMSIHRSVVAENTSAYSYFKSRSHRMEAGLDNDNRARSRMDDLLLAYSQAECSDVRDRVIGLLSLAEKGQTFDIDYDESVAALACRTAAHFGGDLKFFSRLLEALQVAEADLRKYIGETFMSTPSRPVKPDVLKQLASGLAIDGRSWVLESSKFPPNPKLMGFRPSQIKVKSVTCPGCGVTFTGIPLDVLDQVRQDCQRVVCLDMFEARRHVFQLPLPRSSTQMWLSEWVGPVDCAKHTGGTVCPRPMEWEFLMNDWKRLQSEAKIMRDAEELNRRRWYQYRLQFERQRDAGLVPRLAGEELPIMQSTTTWDMPRALRERCLAEHSANNHKRVARN